MKTSQGNYEDRLVKELIKIEIETTIVHTYEHDWRHIEEAGNGLTSC